MIISKTLGTSTARPLFIDFEAYTDGDESFKKELIGLIIDNLHELQQTLHTVAQNGDAQLFHKTCHKIKATLDMLDDGEVLSTVEQLKIMITDSARIALLGKLCDEIVESLSKE